MGCEALYTKIVSVTCALSITLYANHPFGTLGHFAVNKDQQRGSKFQVQFSKVFVCFTKFSLANDSVDRPFITARFMIGRYVLHRFTASVSDINVDGLLVHT